MACIKKADWSIFSAENSLYKGALGTITISFKGEFRLSCILLISPTWNTMKLICTTETYYKRYSLDYKLLNIFILVCNIFRSYVDFHLTHKKIEIKSKYDIFVLK